MDLKMAEIFLLRHAHAEPASPGQDDSSRALSELGLRQARQAAEWLLPRLKQPLVLVSPALRCQQTWHALQAGLSHVIKKDVAAIYDASPGMLVDVLAKHTAEQILLIGHNPGLETTCALLHSGRSNEARGMPTAAVGHLRINAGQAVEPGCAELLEFWWPG